jgi:hypothetical protein
MCRYMIIADGGLIYASSPFNGMVIQFLVPVLRSVLPQAEMSGLTISMMSC